MSPSGSPLESPTGSPSEAPTGPASTPTARFGRRSLLVAGGLTAAAGAGAIAAAPPAAAQVEGGRFNLTNGAWRYIWKTAVHDTTVLQSFAVDYVHGHIYVIQVRSNGGRELGDLVISQMDLSGQMLSPTRGKMMLYGFGHGVNISVEPVGDDAYLWTETDSNPASGYGRAITRFPFRAGTSLTYGSSNIPVWRPVSGSTSNTPGVDMLNRRIAVRYRLNGAVHYRLYDLDEFKGGTMNPISAWDQVGVQSGETFQGWCLYGDYVYQMTGTGYTGEGGSNPPSGRGNLHLSCIDVRTGQLVQRTRTVAGYSLDYREPEGLDVMPTSPPRLCIGLASGSVGARRVNIYYKPQ